MKKNLSTRILTIVLAICILFVFVACRRTSNGNENGNQITNQHKEHNYIESVVEPTCIEMGYTLYSCSCGDSYKDNYIEALGHVYTTYNSNNDATCLIDGTKTAKCERCGAPETVIDSGTAFGHSYSNKWTSNESAHWHSATCEHKEEITDYDVHDMSDWKMTKEPTRSEEGIKIKTCTFCGYIEEQKISRINYDYTEGLHYSLNREQNGYIVDGAVDADDSSIKVSASSAATIAPHCLYKGLPVVEIAGFSSGYPGDPQITEYIRKVIIPETVSSITKYMFGVSNLTTIEVSQNNLYFTTQDGILYNKDKTILVSYPSGKTATSFSVPNGVKEIGESGIRTPALTKIVLPNGLEKLNDWSLCSPNCPSVNLPDSLKFVSSLFFASAVNLLEYSMTTVYKNAMYVGDNKNPYLICMMNRWLNASVDELHPNTKIIASHAFRSINSLVGGNPDFVIPDSVKYIGDEAFYGGNWIRNITVHIGSGVEVIGKGAFGIDNGSVKLEAINVSEHNKYYSSENGVLYNKDKTEIICYPSYKSDASEFSIPSSVQRIGTQAFSACVFLKKVNISESVDIIGDYAFKFCKGLSEITIPSNVAAIGVGAFSHCEGLTKINYNATNCKVSDVVSEYDGPIFAYAGQAGDGIEVTFGANVEHIPNGLFFTPSAVGLGEFCLTSVVFEEGSVCKTIGDRAFYMCNGFSSIELPNSLVSIGDSAFYFGIDLLNITIPSNVTFIGSNAFYRCRNLENVVFKEVKGWSVHISGSDDDNVAISTEDLLDSSNAAYLLRQTYRNYVWQRG